MYTGPVRSENGDTVDTTQASCPSGTKAYGDYHTHGDYSVKDSNGNPVRTGDPNRDDYHSDNFSKGRPEGDIESADAINQKRPGFKSYLGTPSGHIKEYDPTTKRVETLK
jgi:hypothetical protein